MLLHPFTIVFFAQLIITAYSFHHPLTRIGSHKRIISRNNRISQEPTFSSTTSVSMVAATTSIETTPAGKKRPLRSIHSMLQPSDASASNRVASLGDIVTVQLDLTPEDGFVPEHLFDSSGEVTFVLGWGNYLPGLHELLVGMSEGDSVSGVSIDAGFGRHNPEMVIEVPKSNLKKVQNMDKIVPNATLNLQGGIQVNVLKVTENTIVVDANHPLAGSSYWCNLTVLSIDSYPVDKLEFHQADDITSDTPFEVATFAMGCFWGVELAFMRTPGVVGTRAGYTQGTKDPSYEEIKEGGTGHREAVVVIYDPRVVTYQEVLAVYNERMAVTAGEYFKLDMFAEEDDEDEPDSQYKHGLYFHNPEQEQMAREYVSSIRDSRYCDVELKSATIFYSAEEKHQQYLYKGGQAARKGCRETIRCYG